MYEYNCICEKCGSEYSFCTKNKSHYKRRYCNECLSIQKKKAGMLGAKVTNPNRSSLEVLGMIKNAIRNEYNTSSRTLTTKEVCATVGISTKTFIKASKELGIKYTDIISELEIPPSGLSKFQKSVLIYVHEIYPNHEIISEKTFNGLINPNTGCKLKVDIYIPTLRLAIECDGKQHYHSEHYFNNLATQNGFVNCFMTDNLKNEYFKKELINIIRIPYNRKITKQYIINCLN